MFIITLITTAQPLYSQSVNSVIISMPDGTEIHASRYTSYIQDEEKQFNQQWLADSLKNLIMDVSNSIYSDKNAVYDSIYYDSIAVVADYEILPFKLNGSRGEKTVFIEVGEKFGFKRAILKKNFREMAYQLKEISSKYRQRFHADDFSSFMYNVHQCTRGFSSSLKDSIQQSAVVSDKEKDAIMASDTIIILNTKRKGIVREAIITSGLAVSYIVAGTMKKETDNNKEFDAYDLVRGDIDLVEPRIKSILPYGTLYMLLYIIKDGKDYIWERKLGRVAEL